jgi:repressor LexA
MPVTEKERRRLTPHELAALRAIVAWIKDNGIAPTGRELATLFKIDFSPMYARLRNLELKGYLKRKQGVARGLVVLKNPDQPAPLSAKRRRAAKGA